jgi:hypothetical protein
MDTATQSNSLTWDQFSASSQWSALSPARQRWVTAFLANGGNALAATRLAYPDAKEKSIRCMSYEIRKLPEILDALEVYHGGPTREVLLAEVRAAIRKAEPGSVAHQKLLAQRERLVLGIKTGRHPVDGDADESDVQAFPIGSVIVQDGKKYHVKAEEIPNED